jgi:formylglycine-generating enzyme required for sulfatase activity
MRPSKSLLTGICSIAVLLLVSFLNQSCLQQEYKKSLPSDSISAKDTTPVNTETGALPKTFISKVDSAEMILIPAGNFIYGIKKKSRDSLLKILSTPDMAVFSEELSLLKKFLPSYYIDKTEVTNAQYNKFVAATGHRQSKFQNSRIFGAPDQPVVGIGWADAKAYAIWAGKRLPTEEEWEKAARGQDGRMWPWGNTHSPEYYNGKTQGYYASVKVGSFKNGASPYGVLDMAGNVYEMTTGKWQVTSYAMRGGCYLNSGALVRTMFRWSMTDDINGAEWLGFRCVMDTSMIRQ